MGIPATLNGHHLRKPPLTLLEGEKVKPRDIVATTRIGISLGNHLPYRFYLKDNQFISSK
jgi:3-methyladenine DNA glycosylase Mpg